MFYFSAYRITNPLGLKKPLTSAALGKFIYWAQILSDFFLIGSEMLYYPTAKLGEQFMKILIFSTKFICIIVSL